jgi:ABC-type antimicrobial peptide transport system permease subunit
MAVGATGGSVLRMTLGQSLRLGFVGVFAGTVLDLLVTRGLSSLLFEVVPAGPVVYAQLSTFLLSVVVFASFVPAWRSSRIDPVRVLRAE